MSKVTPFRMAHVAWRRGDRAAAPHGLHLVTQLMPAVVLSLGSQPRASAAGAFAGIVAGEIVVACVTISGQTLTTLIPSAPQVVKDLNVGIIALFMNVAVLGLVSLVTARPVAAARAAPIAGDS